MDTALTLIDELEQVACTAARAAFAEAQDHLLQTQVRKDRLARAYAAACAAWLAADAAVHSARQLLPDDDWCDDSRVR